MLDSAIFRPFMSKLSITQWAREDQPREKLLTKGRTTLSNAELIAILINTGSQEQSAVEIAQKIGKVEVEMGGTSCKVPLAEEYIGKVVKADRIGKKRKVARC